MAFIGKKMNLDLHLIPYIKTKSKWTRDLNIEYKIMKHRKIRKNLQELGLDKEFSDFSP